MKRFFLGTASAWLALLPAWAQELPRPGLSNAVIVSIEHHPGDTAEIAAIKARLGGGLYAWLSLSLTTSTPAMDWKTEWANADAGIQAFKTQADSLVKACREAGFRFHLVLTSGLARGLEAFEAAKLEDVRNAQWYNDNNIAAADQIGTPEAMKVHVFGTLSRYARKVRAHLKAKSMAAFAHLAQVIRDNPETLIAVSGWGEAELNYHRINHDKSVQDRFCDYSPFAVLEFRDWIRHEGGYADPGGEFAGQGWKGGGARYRGADGLVHFNADFGTAFQTWDLRYFHWSLEDDFDSAPADDVNPDPKAIPFASYKQDGMMPADGPSFIAGGFDPPRKMEPGNKYWDLWNSFREAMVANFVREAAIWANEAGIPAQRWYSHQIPSDYLFNTEPATPNKNARYYTSASTMASANIWPYGNPGATIYDARFPTWFARTTLHSLPALAALSNDWAIMEFDPELYPPGLEIKESPPEEILEQYLKVYRHGAKLINFWRWWDDNKEHRIKGMNKEPALAEFVRRIKDKARSKDLAVVFTPPAVNGEVAAVDALAKAVRVEWNAHIWRDEKWYWKEWGDFQGFEVYRSLRPGFVPQAVNLIGTGTESVFMDKDVTPGSVYYYKVRALNKNKVPGSFSEEVSVHYQRPQASPAPRRRGGGEWEKEPYLH